MTKVQREALPPGQATFSYRSRKQPSRRIVLISRRYKSPGVFFPTIFGRAPFRSSESLPARLEYARRCSWPGLDTCISVLRGQLSCGATTKRRAARLLRSTPAAAHLRQRTTAYACRNGDRTTWRASIGWAHHLDALQSRIDAGPEELVLSAEEEGRQNTEGRRCPETMDFTIWAMLHVD